MTNLEEEYKNSPEYDCISSPLPYAYVRWLEKQVMKLRKELLDYEMFGEELLNYGMLGEDLSLEDDSFDE